MEFKLVDEIAIWKVVLKVTPTDRPVFDLVFIDKKPKKYIVNYSTLLGSI
jgi:predicted O-methyltransferase YrrM